MSRHSLISEWARRWRVGDVTPMMFFSEACRDDLEEVVDQIVTEEVARQGIAAWGDGLRQGVQATLKTVLR